LIAHISCIPTTLKRSDARTRIHSQENSGIAQGTFLKRHRVPSSTSADGYLSWQELRVGEPFTVYGRTLFINNCDGFTREYYATKRLFSDTHINVCMNKHVDPCTVASQMQTRFLTQHFAFFVRCVMRDI
jgi:hypothetical protein